jgi:fatty-acyl-CoA synthase
MTLTGPRWSGPSLGGLTLRALRRHPERIAFVSDSGSLTYAAAEDLIARFQHVLAARGLRKGDRIAVLGGNSAEAWCAGAAAQASGMAVSSLHPMGSLDDQLFQLADLDAAACIVDVRGRAERAAALGASGVPVFTLCGNESGPDLWADAHAAGAVTAKDLADGDDPALISYTGGTTGRPKGALRHNAAAVAIAHGVVTDFEIPFGARYLTAAPITHVAGTKVLPVLLRGGTVFLHNGFDPARLLAAVERERITMVLAVPTMIYALLDHPDFDGTDLSSLELLLYGAAPMSPARLDEGLERLGPVFSQLYGQTECYPITALHRQEHLDPGLRGSCGAPGANVQVTLLDPDGNPVPTGEPGEICARGPAAMAEYWRRPELTAQATAHGWLHTGDVARADDRGYLTIVDRIKDMIISGGFNVFPREVEDALTSHSAVAAAAVFGIADEKWGEAVTAAVVLRPGATATAGELIQHVRERKGTVQAPKAVRFYESFPATAVGKIDKRALRREWPEASAPA